MTTNAEPEDKREQEAEEQPEQQPEGEGEAPSESKAEQQEPVDGEAQEAAASGEGEDDAESQQEAEDESQGDDAAQDAEPQAEAGVEEEEEPAQDTEPQAEAGAEEEEEEPAPELAADELDLPDGKRTGEEGEIDESELGEAYELPPGVAPGADEAVQEEIASDMAPGQERVALGEEEIGEEALGQAPEPVRRGSPFIVLVQIILFLAVVGMGYAAYTRWKASKDSKAGESPLTFDHTYITKTSSPARPIEDAIAPLDLGKSRLVSIKFAAGNDKQCEVVLDLPLVYWEGNPELKADAEAKAGAVIKAVFAGVKTVEQITFKARGSLSDDGGDKREVALEVVAARADHAKADYSAEPGETLKNFKASYHKALQ